MLVMAILIIFILIGLGEAGSAAADEIAEGKYELDGSDGNLSNEDAAKIAKTATTVAIVVAAVIYGLGLSLSIYFWIVVYSFYKELKEGEAGNGQVMGMGA